VATPSCDYSRRTRKGRGSAPFCSSFVSCVDFELHEVGTVLPAAVRLKALLAKNAPLWGGKSKSKPIRYCTLDFRVSRAITGLEARGGYTLRLPGLLAIGYRYRGRIQYPHHPYGPAY
jgi:hypothetical protein